MIDFTTGVRPNPNPRARKPVDVVLAVVRNGNCSGCGGRVNDPGVTHQEGTFEHPAKLVVCRGNTYHDANSITCALNRVDQSELRRAFTLDSLEEKALL